MTLDAESCYRAVASRDSRFAGRFVVAVATTGVYCRPGCPARLPKRTNCSFFACAAAAETEGFRPCRRCRPDAAPGSPAAAGTSSTVRRALRLIEGGALDDAGLPALAERVGVSPRHLVRLFREHLGASPSDVARTRRVHFARKLLEETALPMPRVAEAAGFASVRSFNHAVKGTFAAPPRALRRRGRSEDGRPEPTLVLRLPFREPLDWAALLGFLARRCVPGVELVSGGRYVRTVGSPSGARGWIAVGPPARRAVPLEVPSALGPSLLAIAGRVSRLLDLSADPAEIARHLRADPLLAPLVEARPGLRIPGTWDPFEAAVRALLGQQVSVAAGRTLVGRLAARCGARVEGAPEGLTTLFPDPAAVAGLSPEGLGLPAARARALLALARAARDATLPLTPEADPGAVVSGLAALDGIGPWTAAYVSLRSLADPDAFPAGDLVLRKALGSPSGPLTPRQAEQRAEPWRPFRAYAALHLWTAATKE